MEVKRFCIFILLILPPTPTLGNDVITLTNIDSGGIDRNVECKKYVFMGLLHGFNYSFKPQSGFLNVYAEYNMETDDITVPRFEILEVKKPINPITADTFQLTVVNSRKLTYQELKTESEPNPIPWYLFVQFSLKDNPSYKTGNIVNLTLAAVVEKVDGKCNDLSIKKSCPTIFNRCFSDDAVRGDNMCRKACCSNCTMKSMVQGTCSGKDCAGSGTRWDSFDNFIRGVREGNAGAVAILLLAILISAAILGILFLAVWKYLKKRKNDHVRVPLDEEKNHHKEDTDKKV